MDERFITLYISLMSKKLEESSKRELLLETHLQIANETILTLNTELENIKADSAKHLAAKKKPKESNDSF